MRRSPRAITHVLFERHAASVIEDQRVTALVMDSTDHADDTIDRELPEAVAAEVSAAIRGLRATP